MATMNSTTHAPLTPAADPAASLGVSAPDPRLEPIRAKIERGERLSIADGLVLYETPDLWTVCELGGFVRERMHNDVAYYNINRHLNYSNVCALSCKFCEFYRKKDQPGAYTRDIDYCVAEAKDAVAKGATEMHIVGGLHPYLPWDYYPDVLRAIKQAAPALHLKAFTAVEIVHLAKIARQYKRESRKESIRWVLRELKAAGLDSLPGGGAEVFDDRVHDSAYKGKIRSDEWLDVHLVAHEEGLNSNATILYGHIDERRERLVHMHILRRAQDQALARLGYEPNDAESSAESSVDGDDQGIAAVTDLSVPAITLTRPGLTIPRGETTSPDGTPYGHFQTITPLPFLPDGSELEHLYGPAGLENLRTIAVARLMLDNFPHVKAFWIMQTLPMAELQLGAGADDIDGTVVWYDITKVPSNSADGVATHQETTVSDLCASIRAAGLRPVERDTLYREVVREE